MEEIVITATPLAGGGKVTGPGTATSDSVPALLSAGEFVVNARSVSRPGVLSLLEELNEGTLPGLAMGGLVDDGRRRYAYGGVVSPCLAMADGGLVTRSMLAGADAEPAQNFYFDIAAPTGTVSRATQQQIAAAASRGAAQANRRNN